MLDVFCAHKILLDIPTLNAMFKGERHHRFLMHLVGHHRRVSDHNATVIRSGLPNEGTNEWRGRHTGLIKRYFTLSCAPNVFWADRDGHLVFITVRPIKEGEQLTITISNFLIEPLSMRQRIIQDRLGIEYVCKCTRCEGLSPTSAQREQLNIELLNRCIVLNYVKLQGQNQDNPMVDTMIDECEVFSRKYGGVPWCEEIGQVVNIHMKLLWMKLRGIMH